MPQCPEEQRLRELVPQLLIIHPDVFSGKLVSSRVLVRFSLSLYKSSCEQAQQFLRLINTGFSSRILL